MANTGDKKSSSDELFEQYSQWKKEHDLREKDIKDEAKLRETLEENYVVRHLQREKELEKKIDQLREEGHQRAADRLSKQAELEHESAIRGQEYLQKNIDRIVERYRKNAYMRADADEKVRIKKREAEAADEELEKLNIKKKSIQAQMKFADDAQKKQLQKEIDDVKKQSRQIRAEKKKSEETADKIKEAVSRAGVRDLRQVRDYQDKSFVSGAISSWQDRTDQKYTEKLEAQRKAREELSAAQADKDTPKGIIDQLKANAKQADKEARQADRRRKFANDVAVAQKAALELLNKAVDKAVSDMQKYYTNVSTRLQGSGKDFKSVEELVRKNLATNPYVKITSVLDSINQLTQKGIVYDLETRGYLLAMKDELVATFDVTNGTLLRLIRLQQADTTAARMGMQSELTKFLNQFYQDTSYFAENISQSISDAMIEATSQMTYKQGLEFEWVVQKWLGSLVSLGLSSSAAQNIAQGLNWLSTGNVTALSGNDQMQTLLAMTSSRAGQSYADILTRGLNAETTNELMKAMVGYLKEIAENENQVVKSAYGNIFNMSVADLRAISNMTQEDISQIYSSRSEMGYNYAMEEIENQLSTVGDRVHLSTKIDNVIDNLTYTVGANIASNPFLYGTYRLNRVVEQIGNKGFSIPFISAFGTGFDLNATINQMVDFGLLGIGLLGSLGDVISSFGNTLSPSLSVWKPQEILQRGKGFSGLAQGLRTGVSQTQYVGNAGVTDMKESTLAEQAESARENAAITGTEEQEHEFDDLFNEETPVYVRIVQEDEKPLKVEGVNYSDRAIQRLSLILPKLFRGSQVVTGLAGAVMEDTEDDRLELALKNLGSENGIPVKVTNSSSDFTEAIPVTMNTDFFQFPM